MDWQDLPSRKNCFTVRNAVMRDLDKNKIVRYYSANTKIAVVQKCVTEKETYYRTESAKDHGLNWAFEASAFGLPNEAAPPAPDLDSLNTQQPTNISPRLDEKQTVYVAPTPPEGGEEEVEVSETKEKKPSFLRRIFRRKKVQ